MNQEIYDTIVELIVETCEGVDAEAIHPNVDLLAEIDVDSLSLLEIVFEIEEKYGVKMKLEEWSGEDVPQKERQANFILGNVIARIETLVQEKAGAGNAA